MSPACEEPVYLSPATITELKFGTEIAKDPGVRQKRLAALRHLQSNPLLTIDAGTGITFGDLAAVMKTGAKDRAAEFKTSGWPVRPSSMVSPSCPGICRISKTSPDSTW